MARSLKRITKEYERFQRDPIDGLTVHPNEDHSIWIVDIVGAEGSIYEGEPYQLQITFGPNYPMDSPEV